ncbi:MAG TPA: hypothetical protein VJJ22_02415 [Candidatus Paceibacterota bacterium]
MTYKPETWESQQREQERVRAEEAKGELRATEQGPHPHDRDWKKFLSGLADKHNVRVSMRLGTEQKSPGEWFVTDPNDETGSNKINIGKENKRVTALLYPKSVEWMVDVSGSTMLVHHE